MRVSKSAFDRLVGYLSSRDHSVRELSTKLKRHHENTEIIEALERADELGLLKNPSQIAQQVAASLLRRGKGPQWIQAQLKKKGLPVVSIDPDEETAKARAVVERKFAFDPPLTIEQKTKIYRYLCNRGFRPQVARAISFQKSRAL